MSRRYVLRLREALDGFLALCRMPAVLSKMLLEFVGGYNIPQFCHGLAVRDSFWIRAGRWGLDVRGLRGPQAKVHRG